MGDRDRNRRSWQESDAAHVAVSLALMFMVALFSVIAVAALIKLFFWILFSL